MYIEVEQTTQWPKEKVQRDKQRSTKHTHKTKDRVTRNPKKKPRERPSQNLFEQWSLSTSSPKSCTNDTKIVLYWSKGLVSQRCIFCFVCLRLVFCVPYVASFFGLSILVDPFGIFSNVYLTKGNKIQTALFQKSFSYSNQIIHDNFFFLILNNA